jgi:hypothetical protein
MNPTQIFELCKDLNIFRKLEKKKQGQWAESFRDPAAQCRRGPLALRRRGLLAQHWA